MSPVLLASPWQSEHPGQPRLFQATYNTFARFSVEAAINWGRRQAGLDSDPIHSHGSDDWYMRTALGPKGLPRRLAWLISSDLFTRIDARSSGISSLQHKAQKLIQARNISLCPIGEIVALCLGLCGHLQSKSHLPREQSECY